MEAQSTRLYFDLGNYGTATGEPASRTELDLEIYADIISVTQTDTDATAGVNARVMRLAPSTRFARYWTGETNPIQISVQRYSTDWELNIMLFQMMVARIPA